MCTCNKMLLHYLLPFHPDLMYVRRETQKPHFVIGLEKEFNTRNRVHPKLVEEPGEFREGRWGEATCFHICCSLSDTRRCRDFRKLLLLITSASWTGVDDSQRDVWESVQNLITAETHTSALPSRGAALQFPLLWTLLSHRQAHLAVRPLLGRMLGRAVSRLLALMVRVMSTPEASTYS